MAQVKEHGARMNIRLPDVLLKKIKRAAKTRGVTTSHIIRTTMAENLK